MRSNIRALERSTSWENILKTTVLDTDIFDKEGNDDAILDSLLETFHQGLLSMSKKLRERERHIYLVIIMDRFKLRALMMYPNIQMMAFRIRSRAVAGHCINKKLVMLY